ncbi:MAG TPA: cyclic nucleotide-binding domain-containing protein [Proteobacteria bacterium]|nr:cAMP receptor protein [bacterium BMS3Abin14]HDL54038.1 cyclic nucleotide-binding domain-containing protein [Pseudomonadota bacterium]
MIEISQLKQMKSFQTISADALNYLARVLQRRAYQDKGPIFNEGTPGGDLYLVGQGAVRITKRAKEGEAQNLGIVPAGRFVGIMTFLSGGEHSADAGAKGETVLYLLDRASFDRFVEEHPADAVKIMKLIIDELVDSLRGMNERYIDMVNYMWRWR